MKIECNTPLISTCIIERANFDTLSRAQIIEVKDESHIEKEAFDVCIKIQMEGFREIYCFRNKETHGLTAALTLMFIEETKCLFIGGNSTSVVINWAKNEVVELFNHSLFRAFSMTPNAQYILDEGETDCLLRNKHGKILNRVTVEPPYEAVYVSEGIKYICDGITGDVILAFKS